MKVGHRLDIIRSAIEEIYDEICLCLRSGWVGYGRKRKRERWGGGFRVGVGVYNICV